MKIIFKILVALFVSIQSFAQADTNFQFIKIIKVPAADFAVDHLNNYYILTENDQLKKFNNIGDSVAVFNQVRKYGKLHSFDVSNPLKPVLFYKDFSTVVILDRFFSIRAAIDLTKLNILQASAAALSYDNNLWIFDVINNKLKKVNEQGNVLMETTDLRMIFSEGLKPQKIIDQNGVVYLYDPNAGLFAFDYFGTLQKKIPIKQWENVFVTDKTVSGTFNNSIYIYNTSNLLEKQYQFPSSFGGFKKYLFANHQLIGLSKDSITIYSFRY